MTVVEYIGSSDVRIISEQILTGAGFTVPGGIRWDKANQFRVDIADNMLVAYLLAQGVFQTEDQETFVGSLNGTYVSEDEADAFWVPADTFITHAGVPAISSFAIGYLSLIHI